MMRIIERWAAQITAAKDKAAALKMPPDTKIIHFAFRAGHPFIWAECPEPTKDQVLIEVPYRIFGPMPAGTTIEDECFVHVASTIDSDRAWHLYIKSTKPEETA